jgi:hypothetical protein
MVSFKSPLPRRVLDCREDVKKLNESCTNFSYDVYSAFAELRRTFANFTGTGTSVTNNYTYTASGNPYVDVPASPNAFDDEFSSGSEDLATRGYTVKNQATGATLTRSGPIAPWDATGPVGNTYWSTMKGSWMYIQGAPGIQIDISKAITLSAGDTYFARMVGSHHVAAAANGRYNELGFYGTSGGGLDNNNRVYFTIRDDTTASQFVIFDMTRFTGGAAAGTSRAQLGHFDIRGVRYDSGTNHYIFGVNASSGQVITSNSTGTPAAGTLVNLGVRNLFSTSTSAVPQIWAIDFIRKKTGNAWIIP